ncbi:MAG: TRAP transporter permease [Deltaproteobacteria bacterium]|nr:TRAP transporter permease [Deltaproteobacteria bacterium]
MLDKEFDQEIQKAGEKGKELLEKFEGKARDLKGWLSHFITLLAIGASLYHLFYAYFHPFFALDHRAIHWGFMSSLIFLLYPFSKKISPKKRPSLFDLAFWLVSIGICLWIFINSYDIMNRAGRFLDVDIIMGTILILLVLEAARRSTGWPVPVVAIFFLLYALLGPYLPEFLIHKGYSIKRISTYLALSTDGVFGVPLGVSANFIFLFILYGAILQKSGAGKFFTDLAFSLTGWTRGGPAKAAVVSSCFFGMISGSSVANTVTTGSFTIPLMKKTGYPPHFAGAVEASASTMGQIMPPIMGAAAFLMAEFLGIPYIKVCIAAAIPAVLSFFAIFMQVHFKAVLMGIKGIPRADLPSLKATLWGGWHHLISITLLVYFLILNFSPERAVFWAILATILCSYLRKHTRMAPKDILEAFKQGAVGSVEVAAACAAAGIIIGCITMTGLGLKFSSLIVDLSGGTLLLALPFTMIACLALGMGVPTTAQYIIISALVAPALIQLGVVAIAAHLFIFYFGTRADITPPVALAAYAGAGIAGSNPMKTGVTAFQLGIAGYIVPFMFIYGPELLIIGPAHKVILATLTATFGVYCLAAGVQNCLFIKTTFYERILLLITSFLLIKPGLITDLAGITLFGIVYLSQRLRQRKKRMEEATNTF